MDATVNPIRLFSGKVERIIAPNAVEATLHIGFGVRVLKRLVLAEVPLISDEHWEAARRCMIVLAGAKPVYVLCNSQSPHMVVNEVSLFVPASSPPTELSRKIEGKTHLTVGPYLKYLQLANFDIRVVWQHLNKRSG